MTDSLKTHCDIAIIGAGAAGLAAAIFAGESAQAVAKQLERPVRIMLLDGAKRIGAKILVSGGGRCNVTNKQVTHTDFQGPKNQVRNILRAFDHSQAREWFESMGVKLKVEETGKLFPESDSARTVLDTLAGRCRELSIDLHTSCRIHKLLSPDDDVARFRLIHDQGEIHAARVIIATGGQSLPKTGSDGQGWALARRLGHTVTPTYPALVPLVLDSSFFHAKLSGIAQLTQLITFAEGKPVDRRSGSMLWTHFGISGPVAMDASRFFMIAKAQHQSPRLVANFLDGADFQAVDQWLLDEDKRNRNQSVARVISARMPARLAHELMAGIAIESDCSLAKLSRERRRALIHAMTALELPVVGHRGWNYAEVTAGGVPLTELNFRSMASKLVMGLYLVGEMIDVDGRIGGFNFQWAWATGHLAGTNAVQSLID